MIEVSTFFIAAYVAVADAPAYLRARLLPAAVFGFLAMMTEIGANWMKALFWGVLCAYWSMGLMSAAFKWLYQVASGAPLHLPDGTSLRPSQPLQY